MEYTELDFIVLTTDDYVQDLIIQDLADLGFESFEDTEFGFKGYIITSALDEGAIGRLLAGYMSVSASYTLKKIEPVNWNQEWENNYAPIPIGDQVYIRASFHAPAPEFALELVIEPKMAFGTGHHDTTYLMAEYLLEFDLAGKRMLDMGCGSGILAILAEKRGASAVHAVDIDEICTLSTLENAKINSCTAITIATGDIEILEGHDYEIILANINRNILLGHLEHYSGMLSEGGLLFMSGFYASPDLDIIIGKANEVGLTLLKSREKNAWCAAVFTK